MLAPRGSHHRSFRGSPYWRPPTAALGRRSADAIGSRLRVGAKTTGVGAGLYTPEQRRRRDASPWTLVQGILAPLQFLAFAVSVVLVVRYLATGHGLLAADVSVVVKTAALYTIMITGALWERDVFGQYLFAAPFFWEDVASMAVIALHSAYLAALVLDLGTPRVRLALALVAYATYVVNATQFVLKLRAARRQEAATGRLAAEGAHS